MKTRAIAMVQFSRAINWANHDDDIVTVNQQRELDEVAKYEPVIKFFEAENIDSGVANYIAEIKACYDGQLHPFIKVGVSVPSTGGSTQKSNLSDMFFYETEYVELGGLNVA